MARHIMPKDKVADLAPLLRSLVERWQAFEGGPGDTSDPELLAGCYIEWAFGDLARAIRTVEVHCSRQYIA